MRMRWKYTKKDRCPFCIKDCVICYSSTLYSSMSPGWQSSSLQIASRVEKRMALAFPVFKIERFAGVRRNLSFRHHHI